ncbi:MAG TPA: dephospho-CoA kinase, partial [bacterium]|nr:dephospho-CoA kinase [bacterium]
VITATPELQISRIMKRDGLSREEAQRRLDAQRPVALKAAEADWVIDNTSTVAHTRSQVEALWKQLTESPRS